MVLSKHIQDCFLNCAFYFISVFIHLEIMFCFGGAGSLLLCGLSVVAVKQAILSTRNAWASDVVISRVAELIL